AQVQEAVKWAADRKLPVVMIGGGSNIVWGDKGFPGLVVVNRIRGYEVFEEDETDVYLTVGAGEPWDSVVERSVGAGLTGIEALSLIPGTAGATPVQNVGAYGQEIAQTLTTVEAYDARDGRFVTLAGGDCGFSYRDSRFKTGPDHGRFFITGLTLHLRRGNPLPPFYGSVQTYFDENKISEVTPAALRQAVVAIRQAKLPDPAVVRNTGSFFANPIINQFQFSELQQRFQNIPHWAVTDTAVDGTVSGGKEGVKLSAAWLIEQAGFKDHHDEATGMATWPRQSLVLVNEKARSTADLLAFKQKIIDAVQAKFGVTLQQEPELI
ncbi:MAG: UDP-N-acetylmuramate dehydrogenase, partial [Candidatus Saccharimonadales bacterium]